MTESKRQLRCWQRPVVCDEVPDVKDEHLYERGHGVVPNVWRVCLHGRGHAVALSNRSGSAQQQYGRGDHRAGVSLPNDDRRDEKSGALVQHAQAYDGLLRGVQKRGAQVHDEQVRVLAFALIWVRLVLGLQLQPSPPFQARLALTLYFLIDTKYQDVHYMGYHSASRSNDLHVVLCGKDLHGILAGYYLLDQGLARRLYDGRGHRDELGPHGELVPNGVQAIHDGQVHYDAMALHDGWVQYDELMAHGALELRDAQLLECDVLERGVLVVNVARGLVHDVHQHHGAHARQHDDQQEHDAHEQRSVLDHEQFAQKLRGDQVDRSDDPNGSHHMAHVLLSDHGDYNHVLGDEHQMDGSD